MCALHVPPMQWRKLRSSALQLCNSSASDPNVRHYRGAVRSEYKVFVFVLETKRSFFIPWFTFYWFFIRSMVTEEWLRFALFNGPNRVGVSLPSPEDGNRSSFRNVMFSNVYNAGIIQGRASRDSECCVVIYWTPLSCQLSALLVLGSTQPLTENFFWDPIYLQAVIIKKKLHGLSPRANYTDRATAACRRSGCQFCG
jgi:hypothetical protein